MKIYFKSRSFPGKWFIVNTTSELYIRGVFADNSLSQTLQVRISNAKQSTFCEQPQHEIESCRKKLVKTWRFSAQIFPKKLFSILKVKVYTQNNSYRKRFLLIQLHKKNNKVNRSLHLYENMALYDNNKQTILLFVHEMSLTGAPLSCCKIAQCLKERYNILLWICRQNVEDGLLLEQFKKSCYRIYLGFNYLNTILQLEKNSVQFAILNSIVTANILPNLQANSIKSILLIREHSYFINQNLRELSFKFANAIVVNSFSVKDSYCEAKTFPQDKIIVRPQGFMKIKFAEEYEEKYLQYLKNFHGNIVLACGTIFDVKGFDLFLQTACTYNKLFPEKKTLFVWLGNKMAAQFTPWYKVYQDYLAMDNIYVIPTQRNVEPFFRQADIFYMCSRIDACPNVVIEAMHYHLPVILFDKGCGCKQFFTEHTGAVIVPYLDTYTAAREIENLIQNKEQRNEMGKKNNRYVVEKLNFQDYVTDLVNLGKSL